MWPNFMRHVHIALCSNLFASFTKLTFPYSKAWDIFDQVLTVPGGTQGINCPRSFPVKN